MGQGSWAGQTHSNGHLPSREKWSLHLQKQLEETTDGRNRQTTHNQVRHVQVTPVWSSAGSLDLKYSHIHT